MEIDLQYLLFLQNLRLATGGFFDEIFNALSKIAVDLMPFMPYVVFWAVNKSWGYRGMFSYLSGDTLNGVIKLTVCAYRPWIRSSQIEPAGDSKTAATGYSFPSGHSLSAAINYGLIYVWSKGKKKGIAILSIILILLTGFSRNFLGVHTPQDVIIGLTEGFLVIWIVGLIQKKTEGNEKLHDILTAVGIIAVFGVILYVTNKSYPMDYDADGKLLVNPQSMMNDVFKACGSLFALLVGSFVERHYIHYEIPAHSEKLPALAVLGFVLMFAWKKYFEPATVVLWLGKHWGYFVGRGLMVLFAMIVWPLVIQKETTKK